MIAKHGLLSLLISVGGLALGAAAQDPDWQSYVRGPFSDTVLPAKIVSGQTYGSVTNPDALLTAGGDTTTLSRPDAPPTPPSWPAGTTADASSYSAPNMANGQQRTYDPKNAIDSDLTTFWNDNTQGAYPDVLTITPPSVVNIPGITIQSNTDGVPQVFTVDVLQNGQWVAAGSVTGNTNVRVPVDFGSTLAVSGVRITVTRDQNAAQGEFTRINEVWPAVVPADIPSLVVDFGQNVVGFLNVNFAAGASTNNPGIRLAFSETLQYLSDISDFSRSNNGDTITPGSDQIAVGSAAFNWTDANGCQQGTQVCADGLHGFRYVKIYLDALPDDAPYTSASGTVVIDSVSLDYSAYIGTPASYTGWFACSDDTLTQQWYDASHTNEMTIDTFRGTDVDPRDSDSASLEGKTVLFDGAKRDRDPYVGDMAVSARTLYLTHNLPEAARNVLADLADHQRADGWIPPASLFSYGVTLFDYPLYWVTCTYDYMVYTGDVAFVQTYYSNLVKVLDTWYPSVTNTANSLLSKGLSNTGGYGDYAFLARQNEVTYYNALYVVALKNAASMAQTLNQSSDADRWLSRASALGDAINNNLWDAQTGAYIDSLSGAVSHPQDGNSMAVLAGVSTAAQSTSLLSYLDSKKVSYGNPFYDNDSVGGGFSQRVYAFISYFEVQARFIAGSASTALDQLRRTYNYMSTSDPGITFWEGIGGGGSLYEGAFTSAAHGWSTGILPALTNYVLGVIPTGPGFKTWTVQPIPGDITWAQGVVPTPEGPFSVSWTTQATGSKFSLTLTVPTGTSGTASVPVSGSTDRVSVDGTQVWDGTTATGTGVSSANGYVTVPLSAGQHTVVVS